MANMIALHRSSIDAATLTKYIVGLLCLIVVAMLLANTVADPDLWGHLRFGLDVLADGRIVRPDTYSYLTTGKPWINHEWLAEVVFAVLWSNWGVAGLVLFKIAAGLAIFSMLYFYLTGRGVRPMIAGILVVIAYLLVISSLFTVRPQLFTMLFFTLELYLLKKAEEGSPRLLWLMPVIFALWVNAHGGFLAGLAFFLLWIGLSVLSRSLPWRTAALAVVATLLALLANPYGVQLLVFLARTATVPRPEISEWVPVNITSLSGAFYLLLLGLSIFALSFSRQQGKLRRIILLAVAALLPLTASRHLALFAIASLFIAGDSFRETWERFFPGQRQIKDLVNIALLVLLIPALFVLARYGLPRITTISFPSKGAYYPVGAVSILKDSHVSGNLAVDFNWGEYALWYLHPSIKVSVDGRRETVYKETVYQQNLNFRYGRKAWDEILRLYPTDFVLTLTSLPAYNLMSLSPGWTLVYKDETSALFVRRDYPALPTLLVAAAVHPTPLPQFFPSPP